MALIQLTSPLRNGLLAVGALLTVMAPSLPTQAADLISALNAKLAKVSDGENILINKTLARSLYLEKVKIKSHGIDFLNGCKASKINKHAQLPDASLPVTQYRGFTIVGSPYHSVPIKTGQNNNAVYFKRLMSALKIIEDRAPDTFNVISKTMKRKNGYIIVDNVCPTSGGLAFAAFIPRKSMDRFVVMVSSTLLLLPDMFSDYDIAAQLVHEMEGHAMDFYRRGTTDESHAFTVQAAFAETVGDDRFLDVNNRTVNIKTKVKLMLSSVGTYVDRKPTLK